MMSFTLSSPNLISNSSRISLCFSVLSHSRPHKHLLPGCREWGQRTAARSGCARELRRLGREREPGRLLKAAERWECRKDRELGKLCGALTNKKQEENLSKAENLKTRLAEILRDTGGELRSAKTHIHRTQIILSRD